MHPVLRHMPITYFLISSGGRLCLCASVKAEAALVLTLCGTPLAVPAPMRLLRPLGTRAFAGLRGDKTLLVGIPDEDPGGGGKSTVPVTRLLIGGRAGGGALSVRSAVSGNPSSGKLIMGELSVPWPRRLDFSCFIWTERKCCNNSCHLMSSRPPSFDRVLARLL